MFAHCLTTHSAMLIKEVDPHGEWVLASYSYVDSNGVEQTTGFGEYDIQYDTDSENPFFVYEGERFYLEEFHSAHGFSPQET